MRNLTGKFYLQYKEHRILLHHIVQDEAFKLIVKSYLLNRRVTYEEAREIVGTVWAHNTRTYKYKEEFFDASVELLKRGA